MTIRIEITGETAKDLAISASELAALLNGGAVVGKSTTKAADKAAQPGAASAGSAGSKTSSKTEPTSAEFVAGLRKDVGATATVVEPETVDDGLGDTDDGLGEEVTVTLDDVRTVLVQLKNENKSSPNIIADLVKSITGAAAKLADVKPEFLPALYKAAQAKLKG